MTATRTFPPLPRRLQADPARPAGGWDGATLGMLFGLTLMIIPARLVLRGIPLSLTPANIVSLGIGLTWMAAALTTTLGVAKGRTAVRTALFFYITSLIATYGVANAGYLPPDESKLADHALVLMIANVGLAIAVCDGVRSLARLEFMLRSIVIGGAIIAIIGALQFKTSIDLTEYLNKIPGLRFATEGGVADSRNAFKRVASTTGHPIEFGVVCAMILPIAIHFGFLARHRGEPARRWWFCALLIAMGLMFSVSRSAVVGVGAVALVLLIGWPARRRLQALLVSLVFLGLTRLFIPGLIGTLYGLFANFGSDVSVQYRTHRYEIAQAEIARHLWLGRGMATWYAPKYIPFDNEWIMSTVQTGVLGIMAFAAIFLSGIYSSLRARYLSADPGIRDLGLTLVACLVVPMAASATFDLLSFGTVSGLAFLLIGSTGALLRISQETHDVRTVPVSSSSAAVPRSS